MSREPDASSTHACVHIMGDPHSHFSLYAQHQAAVKRNVNPMNRTTAFVGLWLLFAAPIASQPKCTFPGKATTCPSPNGQWRLQWQEAKESGPHLLVAWRVGGGGVDLLTFDRSIDVLWSPQSTYVAINDQYGSGDSNLLVVELFSTSILVVDTDLQRMLKQRRYYENGHRLFNPLRWQTDSKLVFEVKAYDAEPGVEPRGTFIFDAKIRTVKRRN